MNSEHIIEHLKVAQLLAEKDGELFLAQIIAVAINAAKAPPQNRTSTSRESAA
jgi:hypothetical protein